MSAARRPLAVTGAFPAAAAWALATTACAPAPTQSQSAPPIAAVHRHQCGRCHSPPDPGSHTRAQLEDAFSRHRSRVHLTGEEWAAMVDYLSAPDASAALRKR
jgi:Spy/CpxP family protein refolding chaperone